MFLRESGRMSKLTTLKFISNQGRYCKVKAKDAYSRCFPELVFYLCKCLGLHDRN